MNEVMDWFVSADLREYADKYIAIVGQRVISSGDDHEKVYNEEKAKYPKEEVILWKVPRKDLLILGRLDVFDRFDVTLRQNDKKVLFDRVGEE
jgi:hypothetical protein